jgi:hypothetical protein
VASLILKGVMYNCMRTIGDSEHGKDQGSHQNWFWQAGNRK